jgi:hypothetical protein
VEDDEVESPAEHAAPDDEVIDDPSQSSQELLAERLGAKLIEEIRHD